MIFFKNILWDIIKTLVSPFYNVIKWFAYVVTTNAITNDDARNWFFILSRYYKYFLIINKYTKSCGGFTVSLHTKHCGLQQ